MHWIWQRKYYELGNFIVLTPGIVIMHRHLKSPVPVFFDTPKIAECYRTSGLVRVLPRKPASKPILTTLPNRIKNERLKDVSDYVSKCRQVRDVFRLKKQSDIPMPFIGKVKKKVFEKQDGKKYIAFFNGCLSKNDTKADKKSIHGSVRRHAINQAIKRGFVPVILGNKLDRRRFWGLIPKLPPGSFIDFCGKLSLYDSVCALNQCDYFISNDTGLYHVAGALGVPGLVLWKKTNSKRNRSPRRNIKHCVEPSGNPDVYRKAVSEFLGTVT